MQCLKCEGELKTIEVDGLKVEKCELCSGIWFDFGELDELLDAAPIAEFKNEVKNNMGDDNLKVQCPRCKGNGNMIQVTSLKNPEVHIDTCSVCYGQWLDGGEFEKLTKNSFLSKIRSLFK